MSNVAKWISIAGIFGVLLYAVVSYLIGTPTFESKWILYSWLSFIIFLHFVAGYFSGEIAFGNFVVKRTSSKIGYIICMFFMALLVIFLGGLAYDFARV